MNRKGVNNYFTEPVMYGGIPSTRAEIIAEQLELGYSRREIDFYLIGLDHRAQMVARADRNQP